jgi:hypothetical protein
LRRSISILLAGLLAWFSAGAVERSAAAALDDASWAVGAEHAVLGQVAPTGQELIRPRAHRGTDAVLGRFLAVASPTLPASTAQFLRRSSSHIAAADISCPSARSSRGPPA